MSRAFKLLLTAFVVSVSAQAVFTCSTQAGSPDPNVENARISYPFEIATFVLAFLNFSWDYLIRRRILLGFILGVVGCVIVFFATGVAVTVWVDSCGGFLPNVFRTSAVVLGFTLSVQLVYHYLLRRQSIS